MALKIMELVGEFELPHALLLTAKLSLLDVEIIRYSCCGVDLDQRVFVFRQLLLNRNQRMLRHHRLRLAHQRLLHLLNLSDRYTLRLVVSHDASLPSTVNIRDQSLDACILADNL